MIKIFKDKKSGLYLPNTLKPESKGYSEAGASIVRRALKAFTPQSGSPREDIDWNNATLRQRGRMLFMASPVATSAIKTNRTSIVGVGLKIQSNINREILGMTPEEAKEWQKKVEVEFNLWASKKQNCDATGVNNFYSLQQLALMSWLMSGDCFPLFKRYSPTNLNPYSLRIHLLEADRISTPIEGVGQVRYPNYTEGEAKNGNKIYDGVEVDKQGQIVAYHIRSTYPYQITTDKTDWIRVEAYGQKTGLPNILHIMDSERPDQYRGVTYLAAVIEPLLQIRRYTESELMAALVQSFFTAWVKTTTAPGEIPYNETFDEDDQVSDDENEYEMGPGEVIHLKTNEEITFGNPNIPTAGFDKFVHSICELCGAALEIPVDVLLKKFDASYSASRAGLLQAWEAFRMRRQWFVDDFCQPTYEVWLAEAVARGRIKAPGFFSDPLIRAAWSGARWIGPAQGQIDPQKEVKAAIMAVNEGFKTREQVTMEMNGGSWEDNAEQLTRENEMLKKARGVTNRNNPNNGSKEGGFDTNA